MAGPTASSPRIPAALQQIFLASQKGEDVNKISAPSNGIGFRIFRRGWGRNSNKKATQRPRIVKAPTTSSLSSDRSNRSGSKASAADASRKAMKEKNSTKAVSFWHIAHSNMN